MADSSIKPEEEIRRLVADWTRKANRDFAVATHLATEGERFRDAVGFHCQQALEKYLKAVLVRHQVEFAKTHDLDRLLGILRSVAPEIAEASSEAGWLTPFGVDFRYPGDFAETLPEDERRAVALASHVKSAFLATLAPYLSGE